MPIISQFLGIIIRMYFNDEEQHHTPHFHAKYAEFNASIDFDGNVLAGDFPKKQLKYVAAWAELHKEELAALWELMQTEEQFFKIRGLE